jgi:hypothetical protein
MFRKYSGGMFVPCGTYLNTKDWEFHGVPQAGDVLDGEGVTYYRLPLLLVIALAPLIGLAFILFLPVAVPAVWLRRRPALRPEHAWAAAQASPVGQVAEMRPAVGRSRWPPRRWPS